MKKILITGASGFIGKQLLEYLRVLNYEIAVISRKDVFFVKNVKTYKCDLGNAQELVEVFSSFEPNIVIHHAAQPRVRDPVLDFKLNVLPSLNLIDLSSKSSVEKFIFSSSGGAVCGEVPSPFRASVGDSFSPNNSYGMGKLTVENYLNFYGQTSGLKFNILRYSNVVGRFSLLDSLDFIIPKLVQNAYEGLPLEILSRDILGDSGLLRDYISVGDIIKVNLMCIDNIIVENLINVCTGKATSVLYIASLINKFFDNHSEIQFLEPREGMVKRSVLDPVPLERYLTPIDFEIALEDALNNI